MDASKRQRRTPALSNNTGLRAELARCFGLTAQNLNGASLGVPGRGLPWVPGSHIRIRENQRHGVCRPCFLALAKGFSCQSKQRSQVRQLLYHFDILGLTRRPAITGLCNSLGLLAALAVDDVLQSSVAEVQQTRDDPHNAIFGGAELGAIRLEVWNKPNR